MISTTQHRISQFLQISLVMATTIALVAQQWLIVFHALLTLIISFTPSIIERNWRIHTPVSYTLMLNLFIYSAIFLGSAIGFYNRFWWWDTALHTLSGVTLGFIGFLLLYTLYQRHRVDMGPGALAIFAFCFAVAVGALWEIFEFTMDQLVGTNMQKNGLNDTMWDLIVDSIGAMVVASIGYLQIVSQKRGWFQYLLNQFLLANTRLTRR